MPVRTRPAPRLRRRLPRLLASATALAVLVTQLAIVAEAGVTGAAATKSADVHIGDKHHRHTKLPKAGKGKKGGKGHGKSNRSHLTAILLGFSGVAAVLAVAAVLVARHRAANSTGANAPLRLNPGVAAGSPKPKKRTSKGGQDGSSKGGDNVETTVNRDSRRANATAGARKSGGAVAPAAAAENPDNNAETASQFKPFVQPYEHRKSDYYQHPLGWKAKSNAHTLQGGCGVSTKGRSAATIESEGSEADELLDEVGDMFEE